MAKKGRKQKYLKKDLEKLLPKIEQWGKEGLIDSEIAKRMGLSIASLYNYKNKFPFFAEALENSKKEADFKVKESLYKKALGYNIVEIEEIEDEDGNVYRTKKTKKHIPASEKAIQMWLQNREPEEWSEKKEHKVEGISFDVTLVDEEDDEDEG